MAMLWVSQNCANAAGSIVTLPSSMAYSFMVSPFFSLWCAAVAAAGSDANDPETKFDIDVILDDTRNNPRRWVEQKTSNPGPGFWFAETAVNSTTSAALSNVDEGSYTNMPSRTCNTRRTAHSPAPQPADYRATVSAGQRDSGLSFVKETADSDGLFVDD